MRRGGAGKQVFAIHLFFPIRGRLKVSFFEELVRSQQPEARVGEASVPDRTVRHA